MRSSVCQDRAILINDVSTVQSGGNPFTHIFAETSISNIAEGDKLRKE